MRPQMNLRKLGVMSQGFGANLELLRKCCVLQEIRSHARDLLGSIANIIEGICGSLGTEFYDGEFSRIRR